MYVRNTFNYHVVIALGLFEISSTITLSLAVFFSFFVFGRMGDFGQFNLMILLVR